MNKKLKTLLIAFTLSSFTFIHIVNLIKENVFEFDILFIEKASLITNFFLLGIILFGLLILFKKVELGGRNVISSVFYILFIFMFISNQVYGVYRIHALLAPRYIIVLSITVLFLCIIFITKFFLKKPFHHILESSLLIASPLSFIVLLNIFLIPITVTSSKLDEINQIALDSNKTPVFFFLFDMFSQYRLNQELERDNMPNFEKLIDQSIYLTKAYSAGNHTYASVNGMLFGCLIEEIDKTIITELKYKAVGDSSWRSSSTSSSIFSDFMEMEYKTFSLTSGSVKYSKWYGKYIQGGHDYVIDHPISNFIEFFQYPFRSIYNYLVPPFIKMGFTHPTVMKMNSIINSFSSFVYRNLETNIFSYIHFPIPHFDFVYNRYGPHKNPIVISEQAYIDQIYYCDTVLGILVELLKKNKIYDRSLIIIASDHGWSTDLGIYEPQGEDPLRLIERRDETERAHVTLIIKTPRQSENITLSGKYSLVDLRNFLNIYLKSQNLKTKEDIKEYFNKYEKNNSIQFTKNGMVNGKYSMIELIVVK